MTLLDTINNDMKNYMKEKDSFSLGVVRMVKGAIQLESINKKKELTDEEIISVISKQIKMRKDSIVEFEKGNRQDLVEQNKKEIEILNKYMPEQLSMEEINKIIVGNFFLMLALLTAQEAEERCQGYQTQTKGTK